MGGLSAGWHHLAVVGTGTTTRFYVDGVCVGSSDRKAASSDVYAVGNYQSGSQRFADKLDDVRIYVGALSETAIATLASGGEPEADVDGDGIPDASDPDDDNDGMPDVWETAHGLNSKNAGDAGADADGDGLSNVEEYIAGTDPRSAGSQFMVQGSRLEGMVFVLRFLTETGRLYGVAGRGEMTGTSQWVEVTNGIPGTGGYVEVRDPVTGMKKFYRIMVRLP